ncbi:uncharacterized protein LOC127712675 [Mytilus californianus]|uniref:uncharacterized protein LOC127712675 n=1 Tax=Mytilus californianus TaxID=6549 RepID=UPI00224840F6|nr:uncharacterized protein LOC127712675 [Mytilus californianus]
MFPNFLRRFLLITEVAVNVVRKFIESKYQPDNFKTFLEKNKTLIYHLQGFKKNGCCTCVNINRKNIIYKKQFEKLFIDNGQNCPNGATHCHCTFKANPNIQLDDIDLTLIGTLLKNCCTLDQQQEKSVTVIREIRNETAHYSHKNDIDGTIFRDSWCEVSDASEHLALCIGENYSKEILDQIRLLRARTLSPVEYTDALKEIIQWLRDQNENDSKILHRIDSMEKTILEEMKNRSSIENRPTTEVIALDETECKTGFLDISVSPAEAYIIPGNNHIIQCTVKGIPTATSIEWRFTPNGGNQHSLNIGGWDGKYTGGCTQNPSLIIKNIQPVDAGSYVCYASNDVGTFSCDHPSVLKYRQYVPMFEKKGFTNEATVIMDASKTSPTSIGLVAIVPSTELIYQRSSPGQRDGNYVETDIYKRIDGMRVSGKECRKTALSYSLLVYAALRGSISLGQEYSPEFTEIAKYINDSEHVLVSSIKNTLETKLFPAFLTKVGNSTYSPRDKAVAKSIIHSFGKKFEECLLKFCSFDILFDHVRFREVNENGDLLEVDSEILANSFFWRIQFKQGDAYSIGQFMGKLGKEIDCKKFKLFVKKLRQGNGDITFYHMNSLLDGLTREGTNFDVFSKLPTLYDAFERKVDNYQNTIFHFIVALYSRNENYKTYMQHFCEKKFVLLQFENCERHTAIDFASLLGRKEVIAIVIRSVSFNRPGMTNRIIEMVTRGVEIWQMPNARVDNLITISLNNVAQGSSLDYTEIVRLIGNDSDTQAVDDAERTIDIFSRNIPIAVSAISELIRIFTGGSTR